jgi:hypothetical protein
MARLPLAPSPARPADMADTALAALSGTPAATRQAREALDVVLAPLRASDWPEVAWGFSRLTASGCPLEVSFSTADPCLRYTAEVAGPEVECASRLQRAVDVITELSAGQRIPDTLVRELARLQSGGHLDWGAWVGGRHDGHRSRYKLYAEVPRDVSADAFIDRHFGGVDRLRYRHPRLEGVGYEVQNGLTELYFRLDGLDIADTGGLLSAAGLGERQPDLLDLMETVYRRPMRPHLPRHPFGVSIAGADGHGVVAVSVFGYAIDVFGDDAATRRILLSIAPQLGWDAEGYRALSAPLAHTHSAPTHHSVVAFTIPRGGPAALTIGMAPRG